MRALKNGYLQLGIGMLVLSAILRSTYGSIASNLAEAVTTGLAAEQQALNNIATALEFVVSVTTPAGAALIAGALLIESQRRASEQEAVRPRTDTSRVRPPS